MFVRDKLFIGGDWARPSGTGLIEVVSASTEELIGRVPDGTADDIDAAVVNQLAEMQLAAASAPAPKRAVSSSAAA